MKSARVTAVAWYEDEPGDLSKQMTELKSVNVTLVQVRVHPDHYPLKMAAWRKPLNVFGTDSADVEGEENITITRVLHLRDFDPTRVRQDHETRCDYAGPSRSIYRYTFYGGR